MNLRHTFTVDGTPEEFLKTLKNHGVAKLEHYLDVPPERFAPTPFVHNDLEYAIDSMPTPAGVFNKIYRLEYYAHGQPAGMNVWEQIEKNIYPTKELGIVIEMTPQLNGQTKVVATCLHPAFEQEFRSIFRLDEQAATESNRGMKAGTPERIMEFHRLVKSGKSNRQAKEQAHCDPSTYYRWCKEVTGEDPILPYR